MITDAGQGKPVCPLNLKAWLAPLRVRIQACQIPLMGRRKSTHAAPGSRHLHVQAFKAAIDTENIAGNVACSRRA
jgi:hypothetical protein